MAWHERYIKYHCYLFIYTIFTCYYYFCCCFDFIVVHFSVLLLLFRWCCCCCFLRCLFINSHFSLSVGSDIWLGYNNNIYWYFEIVIHFRQKYYIHSIRIDWSDWVSLIEKRSIHGQWSYPGFKYVSFYAEKCFRFDPLLCGEGWEERKLGYLFYIPFSLCAYASLCLHISEKKVFRKS